MYKYIDSYVNTNHVTQFPYPLPLPFSHSILMICKAQHCCKKCCIYTVCYFSNWYYFLLPYYNSIVTTPVHWNSHSLLYDNIAIIIPIHISLDIQNNILLINTLLFFKI